MENVGARGTDVSRNSSPQKKQDRFLRSNNTLSSREEDVSKGAKPTERGIVLCSRRLHLPLLWIRVTPGLGLHSQPIIRSRDNNYLKKKKKKKKTSIWPTRDQQRHLRLPSHPSFPIYLAFFFRNK